MNVVVLMLCLMCDYFAKSLSMVRCYRWVSGYCAFLDKRISQRWPSAQWLTVVAVLLPVLLVTLLLQCALFHVFYGVFGLLFNFLILFYALGTVHFHQYRVDKDGDAQAQPVKTVFVQSQQQVFSVMLWFVIFGAVGALFYRLLLEIRRYYASHAQATLLARLTVTQQCLDWVPIRLLALVFAVVGEFSNTFHAWWRHAWSTISHSEALLVQCGMAALSIPEGSADDTVATYQVQATDLVERALLAMLVLFMIIVLTAWVQW
jgi:AmpE protein